MTAHPPGAALTVRHDVDQFAAAGSGRGEHVAEDGGEIEKVLFRETDQVAASEAEAGLGGAVGWSITKRRRGWG
jgi:hypothetical protein